MAALSRASGFGLRLLGWWRLAFAESGGHRSTNAGEQLFGSVGVLSGGIQLKVLVESFRCTLGCNHLVTLGRGLGQQVDALPVVGSGLSRIRLNCLIEGGHRLVHLTGVGEYGPLVEVVSSGIGRLELGGRGVLLHGLIVLARLRISFCEIVMVGADCRFDRDGFLVRLDGLRVLLGAALRITQVEPNQVLVGIDLRRLLQYGDRFVVVASSLKRLSLGQRSIQSFDLLILLLYDLGPLLLLFTHAGALPLGKIKVENAGLLSWGNRYLGDLVQRLAVLEQTHVIGSGRDPDGRVFALGIRFQVNLLAGVGINEFDRCAIHRFAARVFDNALHGSSPLRPQRYGTHSEQEYEQRDEADMFLHYFSSSA